MTVIKASEKRLKKLADLLNRVERSRNEQPQGNSFYDLEAKLLIELILNFVRQMLMPLEGSVRQLSLQMKGKSDKKVMPLRIVFPTREQLKEDPISSDDDKEYELSISSQLEDVLRERFGRLERALDFGYEWLLFLHVQGCLNQNGDWIINVDEKVGKGFKSRCDFSKTLLNLVESYKIRREHDMPSVLRNVKGNQPPETEIPSLWPDHN